MFNESHPDDEVLEQYAMAQLSEAAVEPLEEHILVCAACQDRLGLIDAYIGAMKGAMQDAETKSVKRVGARAAKAAVAAKQGTRLMSRSASGE